MGRWEEVRSCGGALTSGAVPFPGGAAESLLPLSCDTPREDGRRQRSTRVLTRHLTCRCLALGYASLRTVRHKCVSPSLWQLVRAAGADCPQYSHSPCHPALKLFAHTPFPHCELWRAAISEYLAPATVGKGNICWTSF